jgi:predicted MFS family arabinose efflux permease
MNKGESQPITGSLIALMAVACGVSVANLYYSQPLLVDIQRDLHLSVRQAGLIPMLTQVGYAAGMLLFVPLGDMLERRKVIVIMLCGVACALACVAVAPNLALLLAASLLVGVTTVVPQLIVPFAAALAEPSKRGKTVGTVMSGLLIGILLARTVSGFVGEHFGWRAMYWIAALLMIVLAALLWMLLPRSLPSFSGSYRQLMLSLFKIVREEPVVREAAITGALLFAAFSAFWTTLVFLLEKPPYQYGSQEAGLFGLVGAAGALGATFIGRLADRVTPHLLISAAILVTICSYLIFLLFGYHLIGLIVGVVLLDLGVQGGHVTNQTRIFNLSSDAGNRMNTIYMVSYFLGGALGSSLAAWGWSIWGWKGVCLVGLSALVIDLVMNFGSGSNRFSIFVRGLNPKEYRRT